MTTMDYGMMAETMVGRDNSEMMMDDYE